MAKNTKTAKPTDKELLLERRNGFLRLSDAEVKKAFKFAEGYKAFLNAAKTERESVTFTIEKAKAAGFTEFSPKKKYQAGDKVYYNNRNKSICLAVIGKNGSRDGVRISAAHIDSPRIDLKPIPLYEANEQALLKTHYYGGVKKYQWTTIPLSMHGKIVRADGSELEICIGEQPGEPQFCISDILPHLGKDQMVKKLGEAFTGEDLNVIAGSMPASKEKAENTYKLNVLRLLNDKYGIVEEDLISAEIELVPAFRAEDVGFDRSLIGAYGHDDRVCAYPSLEAIFNCKTPKSTAIVVLADKEEIGSYGNTGLGADYLRFFIEDLAAIDGVPARHVLTKTKCLSADVTAAYDPTYAAAYEAGNSCFINHGIGMSKYSGGRGKSGGNDASAEFIGEIRNLFNKHDVLWQIGELGKVDQGGGGTVATEVAVMNMDVVDVGVPVLSMHAPWEVVSKLDVYSTYKAVKVFFEE